MIGDGSGSRLCMKCDDYEQVDAESVTGSCLVIGQWEGLFWKINGKDQESSFACIVSTYRALHRSLALVTGITLQ
jgi:hypothetical protein